MQTSVNNCKGVFSAGAKKASPDEHACLLTAAVHYYSIERFNSSE